MSDRSSSFLLVLSLTLLIPSSLAVAQTGIGGRPGFGGARPGAAGTRGLSSPRSGLGTRSNPVVNPGPSLTPHEVLNPRGSLSSGQVLNPAPSIARPRTGGTLPATQQTGRPGQSVLQNRQNTPVPAYRSERPEMGNHTTSHFDQLNAQLLRYKNGESWAQYLTPNQELLADETTEVAGEEARRLLKRFSKLSNDPTYAKVTALPAFQTVHESLKQKVVQTGDARKHVAVGDRILQAVTALEIQLSKVASDSQWPKRLSLNELRVTVSTSSEHPATDDERKSITRILNDYQAVAKNEQDKAVSDLPEFKETVELLQEYLKPREDVPQQDLSSYFDRLGGQLREYTNGDSWVEYLALPKEMLDGAPAQTTSEPAQKLLKRFDRLSKDPTYAEVTELVAFNPAYKALIRATALTEPALTEPAQDTSPIASEGKPSADGTDPQPDVATDPKPAPTSEQPIASKPIGSKPNATQPTAPQPTAPKPKTPPEKTLDAAAKSRPNVVDRNEPRPAAPVPTPKPVGERLLKSVVALDRQLAKETSDKSWSKRLSIEQLEATVSMTSNQPSSDSDRKSLEEIVKSYQAIANDKDAAAVNQLPEFKETLKALQEYLSADGS